MSQLVELLVRFLHNLGYVFGTGAAVIFNLLNWQIRNENPELAKHKQKLYKWPMRLLWIGLLSMVFVHTWEVFVEQNALHYAKAAVVYVILLGGIYNVRELAPKVQELAPDEGEEPSEEFLNAKDRLYKLGWFLLIFWVLDFILNTLSAPAHHAAAALL